MKGMIKKFICIALAFGLVFTGASSDVMRAAKKAGIKNKNITMSVGEKKKIVIKNKKKKAVYKYVSSQKAKASVSKSGIIKAKKAGKVNITVKEVYKKKTTKLGKVKVTIKPSEAEATLPPQQTNAPLSGPQPDVTKQPDATKALDLMQRSLRMKAYWKILLMTPR